MYDSVEANLKEYLLEDFGDDIYRRFSLLDIYRKDPEYFSLLRKKGQIRQDALNFIDMKKSRLFEAGNIYIDTFRNSKYEQLIDEFMSEEGATVHFPRLVCPFDLETMHCTDVVTVHEKNNFKCENFVAPSYECTMCGRLFTALDQYQDMEVISLNQKDYINLNEKKRNHRPLAIIKRRRQCLLDSGNTTCQVYRCGALLKDAWVKFPAKKEKKSICKVNVCPSCGMIYIPYALYYGHSKLASNINVERVIGYKSKKVQINNPIVRNTKNNSPTWDAMTPELLKSSNSQNSMADIQRKRQQECDEWKRMAMKKHANHIKQNTTAQSSERCYTIQMKNFVVRGNTFSCKYQNHELIDIEAIVSVIKRDGSVVAVTIPAGYCPKCGIYFIMDSTFRKLNSIGAPICRLSTYKAYSEGRNFDNEWNLSPESKLMQYGYTVSETAGLSSSQRHVILAYIIDNKIMTKSEIISYIDSFIGLRQRRHQYQEAIIKWESDREYVFEYNKGTYKKYGIEGISYKC